MNSILARLHKGESLDQIIADISGGRYSDTNDFEKRYIKGSQTAGTYQGDVPSIDFTLKFMNYMRSIDTTEGRDSLANGSILFPLDQDFDIPLDPDPPENVSSDIFKLIDWSGFVKSTASNTSTYRTGGKSVSGEGMNKETSTDILSDHTSAAGSFDLPAAAKETSPAIAETAGSTASENPADCTSAAEDPAAVTMEDSAAVASESSEDSAAVASEDSADVASEDSADVASEDSAAEASVDPAFEPSEDPADEASEAPAAEPSEAPAAEGDTSHSEAAEDAADADASAE